MPQLSNVWVPFPLSKIHNFIPHVIPFPHYETFISFLNLPIKLPNQDKTLFSKRNSNLGTAARTNSLQSRAYDSHGAERFFHLTAERNVNTARDIHSSSIFQGFLLNLVPSGMLNDNSRVSPDVPEDFSMHESLTMEQFNSPLVDSQYKSTYAIVSTTGEAFFLSPKSGLKQIII